MKKIIIVIVVIILAVALYWGFGATSCKHTFNTYPEKGYCEFDLKTCEGIFGCKEYNKVQISCGSEFNLCEGKGFCDCSKERQQSFTQRDEAIEQYLLTQKEFSWKTESDSRNACVFERLSSDNILFPSPLWVYCSEYKIKDGDIVRLSGMTGPALIDYPNELSFFDIDRFSHQAPRDGSLYSKDIKKIFSKDVQEKILNYYNGDSNLGKAWEQKILEQDYVENRFIFLGEDSEEVREVLYKSFARINSRFNLDFSDKISVTVYPSQVEFWASVFPNNENNNRTTGFADHVNNKIHLTSPNDISIKSKEEMLKVPTHELAHILIPHSWIDIREGIAVYLANQIMPYEKNDIPQNLASLIDYSGTPESTKMSYSFAGLKIKFIIEECLERDSVKFLEFISNPDEELDYSEIGYVNEKIFLESFREYLLNNTIN